MMNEAVTKRFLLYFRLMLLVWILIANAIIHVTGMEYSWLIFLSNIMMFTLEGDVKDRFVTVELGGLVGLILTVIALLSITALTPILGGFFAVDQQPVRLNVAFPVPDPIAGQCMIPVLFWQRFTHRKTLYHFFQKCNSQAAFHCQLIVFSELRGELYCQFCLFHFFRSANISSKSV